jgi:hypothetical protein
MKTGNASWLKRNENQGIVVGHDYFRNFKEYVFMEEPTK